MDWDVGYYLGLNLTDDNLSSITIEPQHLINTAHSTLVDEYNAEKINVKQQKLDKKKKEQKEKRQGKGRTHTIPQGNSCPCN